MSRPLVNKSIIALSLTDAVCHRLFPATHLPLGVRSWRSMLPEPLRDAKCLPAKRASFHVWSRVTSG